MCPPLTIWGVYQTGTGSGHRAYSGMEAFAIHASISAPRNWDVSSNDWPKGTCPQARLN